MWMVFLMLAAVVAGLASGRTSGRARLAMFGLVGFVVVAQAVSKGLLL